MDHFFDQAARILASEMPRRQALKRLGGLVAGGLLATLGVPTAQAQAVCNPPCGNNKKCCTPISGAPFCATQPKTCCGNTKCEPNKPCCPGSGFPFCANPNETCCGNTSCKQNETCCGNACCKKNQTCVSGACVNSPS